MPFRIMSSRIVVAAALTFICAAPVAAQDHSTMDHGSMVQPKGDMGPSSTAFSQANAKMHEAMDITYTGKPDVDFVHGMIAHHQGAIDMARIELEFGKNEAMRKLAAGIIAAQESEIAEMKTWLAKNGG